MFLLDKVRNSPCTMNSSSKDILKLECANNESKLCLSRTISKSAIDEGTYNELVKDSIINSFCQS